MKAFQCRDCEYKTDRKFNLKIHIKGRHKRDATDNDLANIENGINTVISGTKTVINGTKTVINGTKTVINGTKTVIEKKMYPCPRCSKNFCTSKGLKKHTSKCCGVSNKLECIFCHKILGDSSSKVKHNKVCKLKDMHVLQNINNNLINNNTQIITPTEKKNETKKLSITKMI